MITANRMVVVSLGAGSGGLDHLATSLPEHYFPSIQGSIFMPIEENTVEGDIAVGQLCVVLQAPNNRLIKLGNQPPNATSFSSNTDLQGRPSQPFYPIGSLELTNLAPSALPSLNSRDQVPVSGSARSRPPSFKRSCPRNCLLPFNLTPSPPFHPSPN